MASAIEFQSIVYREGEFFVAQCLNVDVSSFGASETEAEANLEEAVALYLEDAPIDDVATIAEPTPV